MNPTKNKTKEVSVYLSPDEFNFLNEKATESGMPLSTALRKIFRENFYNLSRVAA